MNAPLSTADEAMAEYARNVGADMPERAWILTAFDVWVRNPYYVGSPVAHPEDMEWGHV